MIAYLLIIVIVLCLVHITFNYNQTARLITKIPGPRDLFILGNALDINVTPVELFKLGRKYASTWNGIYRIWAYPFAMVNLYNPQDIEVIVSTMKHSEKSPVYSFLKPWLREGLLLSSGAKWQHRRKILTPTFHFNILRGFCVTLEENSQRLVDRLKSLLGEPIDVTPLLSEFTLSSICETAMGTRLDAVASQAGKSYKKAIYELGKLLVERFVRIYLYSDLLFSLSSIGRNQNKHLTTVHSFTKQVIDDRKRHIQEPVEKKAEEDLDDTVYLNKRKRRTAMLDLLISAEKEGMIDEQGIQEEVDTFMFEGHDTTAAGLTFLLVLLANNKHVQSKIVAELKDIFGESMNITKQNTMEDLSKLRYLDCCIKESLRLYPPVPFISRTISETVELSGYTVPPGTICHIHLYDLHREENIFKNPLEFNPDRFLPENCAGRHPYAYIPFSAGPRNCIGQKFAIMEMKFVVAALLREYMLLPVTRPADIEIVSDIVLRNNGPVYVQFERRID